MNPTIYIELNFFRLLDDFIDSSPPFEANQRIENKNQLIEILKESDICIDISKNDVKKLHKKISSAAAAPSCWKDFVLFRALKNSRLKILPSDFSKSQSIHFLDFESKAIEKIIDENNSLCVGNEYDFNQPVSPKSIASISIDKEMNGIHKIRHRSRNVILIEPYIFAPIGTSGNKVPKIPNLIKLLKELFLDNTKADCHLSILYHRESETRSSIIEAKIKQINDELNNPKLTLSAFGHEKNLFQGNRHLITDYSIMDLQHPFDRDDSSISANFLYDGNIKESFNRVKKLIEKAKLFIRDTRSTMGLETIKFGDLEKNQLLN